MYRGVAPVSQSYLSYYIKGALEPSLRAAVPLEMPAEADLHYYVALFEAEAITSGPLG